MQALTDPHLLTLLDDDVPSGDLTTHTLGIGTQMAQIEFRARQPMTVCGSEEAARMFELVGVTARLHAPSGSQIKPGALILEAQGSAASLHRAWKTAQTLVEWASGIASATASIVAAAGGVSVACTRKNAPGTKAMSAKAVRACSGIKHLPGL